MSATKDDQEGTGFIYTNLYEHYRHMTVGKVLRHSQTRESAAAPASVNHEDLGPWIRGESNDYFRQNLVQSMTDLRRHGKRLKTLMQEVDELLKRK